MATLGSGASGCGLAVDGVGPTDGSPGDEFHPDSPVGPDGELPDGSCPHTCSADSRQVLDCKGGVVATCDAVSACVAPNASCVALAWTPARINGVTLWLRADKGVIAGDAGADAAVERWEDQSGKGNHAEQGLPSVRPLPTSFANNTRALDFAGGKWLDGLGTLVADAGAPYAVLSVGQAPGIPSGTILTLQRSGPYSASLFLVATGKMYVHSNGGNAVILSELDLTPKVTMPFQSIHAYAGTTASAAFYINGKLHPADKPGSQLPATGTAPGFLVGASPYPQYWNGRLAEVIVVEGALQDSDRDQWDAYVTARYGIAKEP
jgi:hypothetical protein